ncbi:BTB and MATH domain-containing protein 38-like [Littorina saxatilis]|uniref:BTB domain-containing protein n=1 Tax=Littorina saxatilis TaxID=31220 RepID=A0AAN9GPK8_9CAEN
MANYYREDEAATEDELINPFEGADSLSDLTFVVENRKLHVNKIYLAHYSPVFETMFFSEFAEKFSGEIELPDKNHQDVVNFLLQLYPVHSLRKITDDTLPGILSLADEYMVKHVRRKCKQYIKDQSRFTQDLTMDQVLLYLLLADRCRFKTLKKRLTKEVERRKPQDIRESPLYEEVDPRLMRDIFQMKNVQLQAAEDCDWWDGYREREKECSSREASLKAEGDCIINHIWWSFI